MNAVVDNDVLFKNACYCLLPQVAVSLGLSGGDCGILGAAKYVVTHKIKRAKLSKSTSSAINNFENFLAIAVVLEPDTEEQTVAAQLEASALRLGLSLDPGESQLCAIVVKRNLPLLLTGDKRAINAIELLLREEVVLLKLRGKVMCLEQLTLLLFLKIAFDVVRSAICLEPQIDKSLSICFSCLSQNASEANTKDGLASYIKDLRSTADQLLIV